MSTMHGEVSGLPLKGVVDNFQNVTLTFQIFIDYFHKGIPYLATASLLDSFADLVTSVNKRYLASAKHKKIRRSRFYLSKSGLINKLSPLYIVSKFRSGDLTDSVLRNFVASTILDEDYVLPPSEDLRKEFRN